MYRPEYYSTIRSSALGWWGGGGGVPFMVPTHQKKFGELFQSEKHVGFQKNQKTFKFIGNSSHLPVSDPGSDKGYTPLAL